MSPGDPFARKGDDDITVFVFRSHGSNILDNDTLKLIHPRYPSARKNAEKRNECQKGVDNMAMSTEERMLGRLSELEITCYPCRIRYTRLHWAT